MIRAFILLAGLPFLAACTQFPELERTLTPELVASQVPALVPLGPIRTAANATTVAPEQANAQIDARVNALNARAEQLRGSVLSGAERQRLEQGLR